jgi:hypothetical protein
MKESPKEITDFTYAQAYPGGWLHSPELGDKPATVRIAKAVLRDLKNHKTGAVDRRCIFVFAHPKTGVILDHEYIASKTNAFICATAFGQRAKDWAGHLVTIASVPCDFGPWGSRVAFVGSPDIEQDMPMVTPGQKNMVFKKTKLSATMIAEPDIDPDPDPDPDADPVAEDTDPQVEPETLDEATHEDFAAEPSDEVKAKVETETSDPRDAAERAAYVAIIVKAMKAGPVSNKALAEKLAEYGVGRVIDLDDGQLEDYTTWHDELAKAIRAERAER